MVFSADYIVPELKARERFAAIREMVTHLVHCGLIRREDQKDLVTAFVRREKSISTGLAFGLATPCARFERISDVVMAFGRSVSGIEFASLDSQPAHLILMFIIPAGSSAHEREYMDIKFPFMDRWIKQEGLRGRLLRSLLRSNTAEEIFSLLKKHLRLKQTRLYVMPPIPIWMVLELQGRSSSTKRDLEVQAPKTPIKPARSIGKKH